MLAQNHLKMAESFAATGGHVWNCNIQSFQTV